MGMILIVFETINHEILLGNLYAIGFPEKTYLSDQAFKVNIDNHLSDLSQIFCGIP